MKIESIGYYLPKATCLTSIIESFPKGWQYPINEKTGIQTIRKAGLGEYSLSLSVKAVENCMALSGFSLADIDAIICCNICKYDAEDVLTIEPATAVSIAQHFGITEAQCFDVSNACAGMFTGLDVAKGMLETGEAKNVLVVSGEFITKLGETVLKESQSDTNYNQRELLATLTLGDSAVAMIVEQSKTGVGFTDLQLKTYGEHSHLCTGFPIPNGPIMITQSMELATRAAQYSADHTLATIENNDWDEEEIRYLIPHQTAEKVIHRGVSLLNEQNGKVLFNKENTLVNLKHRGNTSTTTHFVALIDRMLEGKIKEGDKLIFSISASGITIGTALYTMDDLAQKVRFGIPRKKKQMNMQTSKIQKVGITAITTLPESYDGPTDTFAMAAVVLKNTLAKRKTTDQKIGLLIFSGLYVTNHISEPAIAAMLIKAAGISPTEQALHFSENLFAFDIKNGSIGTQKAINTAAAFLKINTEEEALVIGSDIYDDQMLNTALLPVQTGCAALLLSKISKDTELQMTHQEQFNFWKYNRAYHSSIVWNKKVVKLSFKQAPSLRTKYLTCMSKAIIRFFNNTNTSWSDYDSVAIPLMNQDSEQNGKRYFPGLSMEKIIALPLDKDLFNVQIPTVLQQWPSENKGAATLLQIQVAAGLQVSISVWTKK